MGILANSEHSGSVILDTLAKSDDPDEIQQAFHQGLHCLLRLKQPSRTEKHQNLEKSTGDPSLKDIAHCPIEIIKGLTDKGQFQYLTKLMGPQEGTYLYTTQFHS